MEKLLVDEIYLILIIVNVRWVTCDHRGSGRGKKSCSRITGCISLVWRFREKLSRLQIPAIIISGCRLLPDGKSERDLFGSAFISNGCKQGSR